jgi:hypothetical protein
MRRPGLLVLLLVLSLMTSGCPIRWQRFTLNHPLKEADVSFIVPGHTTFAEVLGKLGVPDQLEDSDAGPIARYDFLDLKNFKVDLLSWLPFALPAAAVVPGSFRELEFHGGGAGSDHFRVFFDSHWVAKGYAFEIHSQATEFVLWPF